MATTNLFSAPPIVVPSYTPQKNIIIQCGNDNKPLFPIFQTSLHYFEVFTIGRDYSHEWQIRFHYFKQSYTYFVFSPRTNHRKFDF
jgi:hypothetical protein